MTKDRLKRQFNVDADRVKWEKGWNGLFEVSVREVNGYYITHDRVDGYQVCQNNSVCRFRADLHELEG